MASEPIIAALDAPAVLPSQSVWSGALSDHWALTKSEINFLIAIATVAAFCLGCDAPIAYLHTGLGTVLVTSGASTLNQLIERKFDAEMRRTARRPIAAGRSGSY